MYDLILRDATIVTPTGRQVADVAIKDGRIAYVGPRPPRRRTRQEISAIGRFLMPGVIDTAVQFDPNGDPELWERESRAAVTGGVTTVLALPGGQHPVVDEASARRRLDRIGGRSWVDYALWGAANGTNAEALRAAVSAGLLQAVLARPEADDELGVPTSKLLAHLDTPGVLGVQLERILDRSTELRALLDASQQAGRTLHLVHLSTSEELQFLDPVRGTPLFTAGVTPHHLFLSETDPGSHAASVRTHPPVRPEHDRRTLWTAVKRGRLDCVASDHHPTPTEPPGGEGVPGAELLFPLLLSAVRYGRLNLELLVSLCAESPARIFGLEHKGRVAKGFDADLVLFAEGEVARVQADRLLSSAGWSPYDAREAAPKPDLVVMGGRVVARGGELVADAPAGRWLGAER